MKKGICPKCQSRDVWKAKRTASKSAFVAVNLWNQIHIDRYFCLACGFCEEYACPEDLTNPSKMEAIRRHFEKV